MGLIATLYDNFKNILWASQDEFIKFTGIYHGEPRSFRNNNHSEFFKNDDYFYGVRNRSAFETHLCNFNIGTLKRSFEKKPYKQISIFKETLVKCLENLNVGGYKEEEVNKLIERIRCANASCADDLFHYLELAIYKKINFPAPYTNFQEILETYNKRVTELYGNNSHDGVAETFNLANDKKKPNQVACYEVADMFYYGRNDIPVDLNQSIKYLRKSAGLDTDFTLKRKEEYHYPLALWALSFIFLNFGTDRKYMETNTWREAKSEYLRAITNLQDDWESARIYLVERALVLAQAAVSYGDLPAAYNILGKIAVLTESSTRGIDDLKNEYNMETPEYYFKLGAEKGYSNSYNCSALLIGRKMNDEAIKTKTFDTKKLTKHIQYYELSSDKYNNFASLQLGNYYLLGEVPQYGRDDNLALRTGFQLFIQDSPNGTKISVVKDGVQSFTQNFPGVTLGGKLKQAHNKAKGFYLKALERSIDSSSGWAAYHLLTNQEMNLNEEEQKKCESVIYSGVNSKALNDYKLYKSSVQNAQEVVTPRDMERSR